MREKKFILYSILAGLSMAVVCLGFVVAVFAADGRQKAQALENGYERSFYELCDSVNNLETDLSKLTVASDSVESIGLINDTRSHADSAVSAYAGLPVSFGDNRECVAFFNMVSDWSGAYARSVAAGERGSYRADAQKLFDTASKIKDRLQIIAQRTEGKSLRALGNMGNLMPHSLDELDLTFSDATIEYPSLIYDGPFSEREDFVAYALENKREVSEEQAIKVLQEQLGLEQIQCVGKTEGDAPSYEFTATRGGEQAYATVTRRGGYVSLFLASDTKSGQATLTHEDAMKIGKTVLSSLGYEEVEPIWRNSMGNELYVNYAPVVGGVTYYTDLVKVRLSLTDGAVLGVEATGYVSSYRVRSYEAKISTEQAASKASELTVKSVQKAVIPHPKGEAFCYEVYGERNGLDYYVYVDAVTGRQVDVLRVVDSEQGSKVL